MILNWLFHVGAMSPVEELKIHKTEGAHFAQEICQLVTSTPFVEYLI